MKNQLVEEPRKEKYLVYIYSMWGRRERWEKALGKGSINVGYYCSWLFEAF